MPPVNPQAASLRAALNVLRDGVGREMEVQALLTLLLIAEHGEIAMTELQQALGLGASSMSRNIGKLSATGYRNGTSQKEAEGLGLIEAWENPMDRRQKTARLTPKGRAIVARALKHIGG